MTKDDFNTRKGLTKEPITTSDQMSICLTHSYINGTHWFIKLIARAYIDYRAWVEKSNMFGDPIRKSTADVIDIIYNKLGMRLEAVCGTGGKTGTSTTGQLGRKVFSEAFVPVLKLMFTSSVNSKYLSQILELHKHLSIILRIVSSTEKVDLAKYDTFCNETVEIISSKMFHWVELCHTLHGVLQHSSELIALNDGFGLGDLSEEGLEAGNKDIRFFLNFRGRTCDPMLQITDAMNRLLERSAPEIAHSALQMLGRNIFCKICHATDHTVRSHGRKLGLPKAEYDTQFEELLVVE